MSGSRGLPVWVLGVGLVGPGLIDWNHGSALLCQPGQWVDAPAVIPPASRLPAAERRRAGALVRLSVAVADQACVQAGRDGQGLATVFTSSSGDGANCHALCEALATPERLVSPTRFTNSVHNAAAGYWHIAAHSRAPSTSLCAFDASFSAGLLEAAVQCVADQREVLLVATDAPYPEPLQAVRPLPDAFGVALLLSPVAVPGALQRWVIATAQGPLQDTPLTGCPALETVRRQVPAARALPLLQALAAGTDTTVSLGSISGCDLHVAVSGA